MSKKSLSIKLITLLIIVSFQAPAACRAVIKTAALKQFISETGFKGTLDQADDGRIFSRLEGNFRLPEVNDTNTISANADRIVDALMQIYQQQGASFTLKRLPGQEFSNTCSYMQFWGNFYPEQVPYYLLVVYDPAKNKYTISNQLYMEPISIPEKVIDYNTAQAVVDEILEGQKHLTDLNKLPRNIITTNNYLPEDNTKDERYFRLNLYPSMEDTVSLRPAICLKWHQERVWHYGKYYNLTVNPVNGLPEGILAVWWQERFNQQTQYDEYAGKTGFTGSYLFHNYEALTSLDEAVFSLPQPTDYASFAANATFILKDYLDLAAKLKVSIKVTESPLREMQDSEGRACFQVKFIQDFHLTDSVCYAYEDVPFYLNIGYYPESNRYFVHNKLYCKPIDSPELIISPQTALAIYKYIYDDESSSFARRTGWGGLRADKDVYLNIPIQRINPTTVVNYSMQDSLSGEIVSLKYYYNSTTEQLGLVWEIKSDSLGHDKFDAVNGRHVYGSYNEEYGIPMKPEPVPFQDYPEKFKAAFSPVLRKPEIDFDPKYTISGVSKHHTATPLDRKEFAQKAVNCLDKMFHLSRSGFRIEAETGYIDEEYNDSSFDRMTYRGYDFTSFNGIHIYFQPSDSVLIYTDELFNQPIDLPEFIITPHTAWHLAVGDSLLPMQWIPRKYCKGELNYFKTLPEDDKRVEQPIDEEHPEESYEMESETDPCSYLTLTQGDLFGHSYENEPFRLVYFIACRSFKVVMIDAATGKIIDAYWWSI